MCSFSVLACYWLKTRPNKQSFIGTTKNTNFNCSRLLVSPWKVTISKVSTFAKNKCTIVYCVLTVYFIYVRTNVTNNYFHSDTFSYLALMSVGCGLSTCLKIMCIFIVRYQTSCVVRWCSFKYICIWHLFSPGTIFCV